jgi:hypothetical protein
MTRTAAGRPRLSCGSCVLRGRTAQGRSLLAPLPIVTPCELFLSQDRTASNRRPNAIDDDDNEQDRIQIQKSPKALLQASPAVSDSGSVRDIDSDDGCPQPVEG